MTKTSFIRFLVAVCGLVAAYAAPAHAVVEININKGNVEPLPIAITDFVSSGDIGAKISAVVEADLKRSGLFAPVARSAFIEKISRTRTRRRALKTGRSSTPRRW